MTNPRRIIEMATIRFIHGIFCTTKLPTVATANPSKDNTVKMPSVETAPLAKAFLTEALEPNLYDTNAGRRAKPHGERREKRPEARAKADVPIRAVVGIKGFVG